MFTKRLHKNQLSIEEYSSRIQQLLYIPNLREFDGLAQFKTFQCINMIILLGEILRQTFHGSFLKNDFVVQRSICAQAISFDFFVFL